VIFVLYDISLYGLAFEPNPRWVCTNFEARAVFSPPAGCLYSVVKLSVTNRAGYKVTDDTGKEVPFRLVTANSNNVFFVVQTSNEISRRFVVYYQSDKNGEEGTNYNVRDPTPIRVEILEAPGLGIPETWERMRYLFVKSGKQTDVEFLEGFVPVNIAGENQRGKRKREGWKRWLTRINTLLLCEQSGKYVFALKCNNSAFAFLDGKKIVFRNAFERDNVWTTGEPMEIEKGIYRLDVFHCSGQRLSMSVGWIPPGKNEVIVIPSEMLVSSGDFVECRLEKINRSLHADFTWQLQPPYSFLGSAVVFMPVKFFAKIETWLDPSPRMKWAFDDGSTSSENNPVHVFTNATIKQVSLNVRDSMGFEDTCEKRLDFLLCEPSEKYVYSLLFGVPAVCFPGDSINPYIEIKGDVPSDMLFDLNFSVSRQGHRRNEAYPVKLPFETNFYGRASDFESIEWQLMHCNTLILKGMLKFLKPPFKDLKTMFIKGENIFTDDYSRLVMVLPVEKGNFPPARKGSKNEKVVFLGDGPLVDIVDDKEQRHKLFDGKFKAVKFDQWDKFPEAYGPLLKVTKAHEITQQNPDIIILTAGYDDFMAGTAPPEFERHIAGLTDFILFNSSAQIIWIVVPPYGMNKERIRPYAEAICRIAYRRNIPAIDMFTALSAAGREHFFDASYLFFSEEGKVKIMEFLRRQLSRIR